MEATVGSWGYSQTVCRACEKAGCNAGSKSESRDSLPVPGGREEVERPGAFATHSLTQPARLRLIYKATPTQSCPCLYRHHHHRRHHQHHPSVRP